jgi:hypothetical protein
LVAQITHYKGETILAGANNPYSGLLFLSSVLYLVNLFADNSYAMRISLSGAGNDGWGSTRLDKSKCDAMPRGQRSPRDMYTGFALSFGWSARGFFPCDPHHEVIAVVGLK